MIATGLFSEVRKIIDFLRSGELPWVQQIVDKAGTQEVLIKLEAVCKEFWSAIATVVLKDDKGVYDEALLKAVGYLARMVEAPAGTAYNELGRGLRHFPLVVTLYLISIAGTELKKDQPVKATF